MIMTVVSISKDSKEEICEYLKKIRKMVDKVEDELESSAMDARGHYDDHDRYYSERRYR